MPVQLTLRQPPTQPPCTLTPTELQQEGRDMAYPSLSSCKKLEQ